MPKAEDNDQLKPGPPPTPRYLCVPCDAELGARAVRTHRQSCPCRTMFCAHQDSAGKRGPKPKIRYLCLACMASLSESDVRFHQRDCSGAAQPVSRTATTLAGLKARYLVAKARLAERGEQI